MRAVESPFAGTARSHRATGKPSFRRPYPAAAIRTPAERMPFIGNVPIVKTGGGEDAAPRLPVRLPDRADAKTETPQAAGGFDIRPAVWRLRLRPSRQSPRPPHPRKRGTLHPPGRATAPPRGQSSPSVELSIG